MRGQSLPAFPLYGYSLYTELLEHAQVPLTKNLFLTVLVKVCLLTSPTVA